MTDLLALFSPDFILHNALWGSIAVGIFCPLIGVYFFMRRMVLLGVALPQVSALGIAFVFYLQGLGITWSLHPGEANDHILALAGSIVFTLLGTLLLTFLERRGEGTTDSRVGAAYALAFAGSILWVATSPFGKIEVLNMLHGEIVSVSTADLRLLLGAYGVLAVLLMIFNRQFLLVSFDRESASVMGKKVLVWDGLLFTMIGVVISISVLIVGPMVTFAFLVIPPLTVRRFCKRIPTFFALSSLVGGLGGILGFYTSYQLDWPLGPSNILLAAVLLAASFFIKKLLDFRQNRA